MNVIYELNDIYNDEVNLISYLFYLLLNADIFVDIKAGVVSHSLLLIDSTIQIATKIAILNGDVYPKFRLNKPIRKHQC